VAQGDRALYAQGVDERLQGRVLLTPRGVVQEPPVDRSAHEVAAGDVWSGVLLHGEREPDAVEGRA